MPKGCNFTQTAGGVLAAGVQNSNDAIITTDDVDKIIFWNKRAQEIFGYLEEEVKDQCITRLIAERHVSCYRQEIEQLLALEEAGPPGKNFEITGRRKDGVEFPLEMSLSIWKAQGQRFVTATIRDITQRKRAEAALQKIQASLAKAQRLAHLGSWDWDISKNKISLSDEIFRIFGLTPEEFGGSYEEFMDLIHPEDRDAVKLSVSRVLSKDRPFSLDYRVVRPDGTVRVVQSHGEHLFRRGWPATADDGHGPGHHREKRGRRREAQALHGRRANQRLGDDYR